MSAELIKIIQGADINFLIRVTDENTGDPIDLTNVSAASICFLNSDNTNLTLSLTPTANGSVITKESPVQIGKLKVKLDDLDTDLLALVDNETMELSLVYSGDNLKLQFPRAYSVIKKIC